MSLAAFTEEEFSERYQVIAKELLSESHAIVPKQPHAILLGGQSGAGKTMLHSICLKQMKDDGIIINGDEYRPRHPRFQALDAKYGVEAVSHTVLWSGKMTEALINTFSVAGFNLVIEGTLRTSQTPLQTAQLLKSRGYEVGLALMAVKPEISLISCQIRYELMRLAGTTPRATDPAHHSKIVSEIVTNVKTLETSRTFTQIRLYSRGGTLIYPTNNTSITAAEVLEEVLFGEWTSEETLHYEFLQSKLASLSESSL